MDHLKRNKLRYGMITVVTTGTCSVYYYNHLEYTPFTNRRRFMLFTNDQLEIFLAYKHFGYTITLTTLYYSNIVCRTILVNDLFNRPFISVIGY